MDLWRPDLCILAFQKISVNLTFLVFLPRPFGFNQSILCEDRTLKSSPIFLIFFSFWSTKRHDWTYSKELSLLSISLKNLFVLIPNPPCHYYYYQRFDSVITVFYCCNWILLIINIPPLIRPGTYAHTECIKQHCKLLASIETISPLFVH